MLRRREISGLLQIKAVIEIDRQKYGGDPVSECSSPAAGLTLGVAGITVLRVLSKNGQTGDVKIADIKIADIKLQRRSPQALTGKPGDPEKGRRGFMGGQRGNWPARHITSGHTTSKQGDARTVLTFQQDEDVIACLMRVKEEYRWWAMDGIYSMQSDDKRRNTNADNTA